jgi:parvulin-like peptidyl-prolyl isomerase
MSLMLCLITIAVTTAFPALAQPTPDPVARVNNQPIAQQAFVKLLIDWYGKDVLEEMIATEVVFQAAGAARITVTDQQVDESISKRQQQMDAMKQANMGPSFAEWMASRRLTMANLRYHVRADMLLEEMVRGQISVTPGMVSEFYNTNISKFRDPALAKLSVMAVKTAAEAGAVRSSIAKGETTWGDAVRLKNVDPATMQRGPDLGFCPNDDTNPLISAGFALQHDADISEPVAHRNLFWLVRREDKRSERTLPFEEVKARIETMLRQQQLERLKSDTRDTLTKQAHIERPIEFAEAPLAVPTPTPAETAPTPAP